MAHESAWLNDLLQSLPGPQRERLQGRLTHREAGDARREAAVAWALRDVGAEIELEPRLGNLTPDLLCSKLAPPLVTEVWSRNVPERALSFDRRWDELAARVSKIDAPRLIRVTDAPGEAWDAPSSKQTAQLAAAMTSWLRDPSTTAGSERTTMGFSFVVDASLPDSTSAHLLSPSGGGGTVSSDLVKEQISRKSSKYKDLVMELSHAFMVVVAGSQRSGIDLELTEAALTGVQRQAFTFTSAQGGKIGDATHQIGEQRVPSFRVSLSAVAYLAIDPVPKLTVMQHRAAAHMISIPTGRSVELGEPFGRA